MIEKGLVLKDNKSPAHFSLSQEGWLLAARLAGAAGIQAHEPPKGLRPPSSSSPATLGRQQPVASGSGTHQLARPMYEVLDSDEDDEDEMVIDEPVVRPSLAKSPSAAERRKAADAASARLSGSATNTNHVPVRLSAAPAHVPAPRPRLRTSTTTLDIPFGYHYLDEMDERVSHRADAEQGQEEGSFAPTYRVEYRLAQETHKMAGALIGRALKSLETGQGYMRQRVALAVCPGFTLLEPVAPAAIELNSSPELVSRSDPPPRLVSPPSRQPPAAPTNRQEVAARPTSTSAVQPPAATPREQPPARRSISATASASHSPPRLSPHSSSLPLRQTALITSFDPLAHTPASSQDPSQPVINRHPLDPIRDHIAPDGWAPPVFEAEEWPPGSFTISLVIDTRESGHRKSNRLEIVQALEKLDPTLNVEQRMLPLGDMIWIAKRKLSAHGPRSGADEAVLDCIVERKRLDDLCSSILDGRYLSQKGRMKDSAISDRVYIIERYDAVAKYAQWGKQIWTAKSQLQVNDGFHLLEAASLADTIEYLRNKTLVMKEMHGGRPIHVIPDRQIDRQTYLAFQRHLRSTQPDRTYLTSYDAYLALNTSEAGLTLRAQWGAMVLRVKGISAEKAGQFIERWPTPAAYWHDVDQERRRRERTGEAVKEKNLGDWVGEEVCREGRESVRALKGVVGARVWKLFAARGRYDE